MLCAATGGFCQKRAHLQLLCVHIDSDIKTLHNCKRRTQVVSVEQRSLCNQDTGQRDRALIHACVQSIPLGLQYDADKETHDTAG